MYLFIGAYLMLGSLLSMSIVLYAGDGLGSTQGYLVVLAVMVFIAGFAIGLGSVSYIGKLLYVVYIVHICSCVCSSRRDYAY